MILLVCRLPCFDLYLAQSTHQTPDSFATSVLCMSLFRVRNPARVSCCTWCSSMLRVCLKYDPTFYYLFLQSCTAVWRRTPDHRTATKTHMSCAGMSSQGQHISKRSHAGMTAPPCFPTCVVCSSSCSSHWRDWVRLAVKPSCHGCGSLSAMTMTAHRCAQTDLCLLIGSWPALQCWCSAIHWQ